MNEEAVSKYNKRELISELKKWVLDVHFNKEDGSPRLMRCTLRPDLLPKQDNLNEEMKEFHSMPENLLVVPVWDLENRGWRSFRVDRVNYVQMIDQNF